MLATKPKFVPSAVPFNPVMFSTLENSVENAETAISRVMHSTTVECNKIERAITRLEKQIDGTKTDLATNGHQIVEKSAELKKLRANSSKVKSDLKKSEYADSISALVSDLSKLEIERQELKDAISGYKQKLDTENQRLAMQNARKQHLLTHSSGLSKRLDALKSSDSDAKLKNQFYGKKAEETDFSVPETEKQVLKSTSDRWQNAAKRGVFDRHVLGKALFLAMKKAREGKGIGDLISFLSVLHNADRNQALDSMLKEMGKYVERYTPFKVRVLTKQGVKKVRLIMQDEHKHEVPESPYFWHKFKARPKDPKLDTFDTIYKKIDGIKLDGPLNGQEQIDLHVSLSEQIGSSGFINEANLYKLKKLLEAEKAGKVFDFTN